MQHTVSARQIQREYTKILAHANKINKPIVVISNNQPQGAIIGLDLLEKMQMDAAIKEAREEYKAGKTKKISTRLDLEKHFKEVDAMV